jgi:CDP-6-deoxy-D-xylo-4-hexulose-3-dehydrase
MNYPLAATTWDENEYEAIDRVVKSGMFTMGKEVSEFERRFADYVGTRYAVMVNSGSSANLLAVAALFFRKQSPLVSGSTAIVPAVSWPTTYYPLTQYGLRLRPVDIDPDTLNFKLDDLKLAIDDDVKLIFAVNLLGNANDFSAIKKLINVRDITLIIDNCESLGATFQGQHAGTFGAIGTHSTFFSHHISTMEGGVCVTDDEELYHVLLSMRAHGWTRNLPWPNHVADKDERGDFHQLFRFVLPGYNLRPLEMSGAIGVEQVKKLPHLIAMRRKNAAIFQDLFGQIEGIRIQQEIGQSSWFGFSMVVEEACGKSREMIVNALMANGIECRPIVAGNFFRNPVVDLLPYDMPLSPLVHADEIHDHGFFIGNHHWDAREQLGSVKTSLMHILDR